MTENALTKNQAKIIRHALTGGTKKVYRNHFVAGPGHSDYDDLLELVEAGYMRIGRVHPDLVGGDDCFIVTEAGKKLYKGNDEGELMAESELRKKTCRCELIQQMGRIHLMVNGYVVATQGDQCRDPDFPLTQQENDLALRYHKWTLEDFETILQSNEDSA